MSNSGGGGGPFRLRTDDFDAVGVEGPESIASPSFLVLAAETLRLWVSYNLAPAGKY